MSTAPEDFEQLRKLLKLKRHEQPPPRFFNNFSSRVLDGIEREKAKTDVGRLWEEAPWLARFFRLMETNALAAGGFATAMCALLLGGVVYSQYMDQPSVAIAPGGESVMNLASAPSASLVVGQTGSDLKASTNAIFDSNVPGSPFSSLGANMQPVSFTSGNGQ
ncbi:MAG: hypothetical protein JWR19_3018 [Pedosphaera sp.]|nr:hypothetical protein [Pedosphaera sp.]